MATSATRFRNRATPGVYITEIPAFGESIVGVATAVPVFVGYTEFAGDPATGQPLYNKPIRIGSMADYISYFGTQAPSNFAVSVVAPPPTPSGSGAAVVPVQPSFTADYATAATGSVAPGAPASTVAPTGFMLVPTALPEEPNQFNLYWQLRLFFANGGGDCFIVSCGSYWTGEAPVTKPDPVPDTWLLGSIALGDPDQNEPGLLTGLKAAGYAAGATMTVIPEACQLVDVDPRSEAVTDQGYGTVAIRMLAQASALQDRVAILDLPGVMKLDTINALSAAQTVFWNAIAPEAASTSYGAAYAPALNTNIVTTADILYTNLVDPDGNNAVVNTILTTEANKLYKGVQLATVQSAIAKAFPVAGGGGNTATASADDSAYPDVSPSGTLSQWQQTLDNLLLNALPVFAKIEQLIANTMNVAPPSGALAGIWSKSDAQQGVWNAPANFALANVVSPVYNMNDVEQAGFNLPTNGQAIDIIRAQPTRGTVVWGARTLDGNSNDYRYVQVRRTLIYIEQSIKLAMQDFVMAPNDAVTWATLTASITSFLTGLWQQRGLMGGSAAEAFGVACGVGATMTDADVQNGYMIVAVTLQMIHPAEFIELTFTQKMGS